MLVPIKGCQVRLSSETKNDPRWMVVDSRGHGESLEVLIKNISSGSETWRRPSDLVPAFQLGAAVQDLSNNAGRRTLGEGVVLEQRTLGKFHQVLVEYPETGEKKWLPYEILRGIKSVDLRALTGNYGNPGNSEKLRLRVLSHALEKWDQNTGSLSRLEIDPLPHQIHLVHHILASGNLNWLIADDVGLGKTIEVGMLLSALKHRGTFRRILLVTPAGLVHQWQEELHHKFGMSDFRIYGKDFFINEPRHWGLYDHVIASIDKLKSEENLEMLVQAGYWDVIVFDEAHRLTRRQHGMQYSASERYELAETLRKKTDSMILLSATPHQGMEDKFKAILSLLRPDLEDEIESLNYNPNVISEMVIRNHKADVTDVEGNFIFKGKITRSITVSPTQDEIEFDKMLYEYFMQGYEAGGARGGARGRAIGFVMTVYRKLAASSIAAIHGALERRFSKILEEAAAVILSSKDHDMDDDRYEGEIEEELVEESEENEEFFDGEAEIIKKLLDKSSLIMSRDSKLSAFVDQIIPVVQQQQAEEKILVFTEYRTTQRYLLEALSAKFGADKIQMIHGGMNYREREQAIQTFEESGMFLLSTEAGGEGLNLQKKCHVMVNYDLPWNPMRLVQRIGRLYRYGQQKNVVVLNIKSSAGIDEQIVDLMYERITAIVRDLSVIGKDEFTEGGFHDEVLGGVCELVDVEEILKSSDTNIDRTKERIDQALERAKQAYKKQQDLFQYASGFDPASIDNSLKLSLGHVKSFVLGMMEVLSIVIDRESHGGQVLTIRLPESVCGDLGIRRTIWRITFSRDLAASSVDLQMMDRDSFLFEYFLSQARSFSFDGRCALVGSISRSAAYIFSMLRWQNDQGIRMREELVSLSVDQDGEAQVNPEEISDWLMASVADGNGSKLNKEDRRQILLKSNAALDDVLFEKSNKNLYPENRQSLAVAFAR